MSKKESNFEKEVVANIIKLFPEALVVKIYPNYIPGFPDRIILYKDFWFAFEVKRSSSAPFRPNQKYYIDLINGLNEKGGAMVVYPENLKEFLNEVHRSFRTFRRPRIS